MPRLPDSAEDSVRRALLEDLGEEGVDLTTRLALLRPRSAQARIVAKAPGVLAGIGVAELAFRARDERLRFVAQLEDGARLEAGTLVATVGGDAAAILAAERVALNFLQRLSGIATATRRFVDAVAGSGASILETRKTTPGLRALEKYAVAVGGGENHRSGLYDQVLLKENHFASARPEPYEDVVARAVRLAPVGRPVIAEARGLDEALAAVRGGAGIVMLDNLAPGAALREAIAAVREAAARAGRAVAVEVSGGITLANVAEYAASGVDRISIGALTHSVAALDLSLLVEVER